jgi:aldehyde dehydrogenase (NAD+)
MSPSADAATQPFAELHRVFDLQRANRWRVAQGSAEDRMARLRKLRDGIWAQREKLQRAISDDYRKNPGETDLTEIFPAISEINHTLKNLRQWM